MSRSTLWYGFLLALVVAELFAGRVLRRIVEASLRRPSLDELEAMLKGPLGDQEMDGIGTVIDPDPHVIVNYDRIPKHEVEIRRSTAVMSADGHRLGHVDGFLVGSGEAADIVLERGHLWGRREIVIPAGAVARVETDLVTLSVTKDEVGALAARRVHRWF